jgi:hypothetical protein
VREGFPMRADISNQEVRGEASKVLTRCRYEEGSHFDIGHSPWEIPGSRCSHPGLKTTDWCVICSVYVSAFSSVLRRIVYAIKYEVYRGNYDHGHSLYNRHHPL